MPEGALTIVACAPIAAAGDRLAFDLIHLGQYGPVHYALQRAP